MSPRTGWVWVARALVASAACVLLAVGAHALGGGVVAAADGFDLIAFGGEKALQVIAHVGIVVGHQDELVAQLGLAGFRYFFDSYSGNKYAVYSRIFTLKKHISN